MSSGQVGGSAEEAFEALRAQVALLHKAVEGMAADARGTVDYSPTLGAMAESLGKIEEKLNSPALSETPEFWAGRQAQAVASARRDAQDDLKKAQAALLQATKAIEGTAATHQTVHEHRKALVTVGASALVVGIGLYALLAGPIARRLPESWQAPERMAAATLGLDRWEAGSRLMHAVNPESWANIVIISKVAETNQEALQACIRDAKNAGKDVPCRITVAAE